MDAVDMHGVEINIGDKVRLRDDVLRRHAQSVPAHLGYTTAQFAWRSTLRNLADETGTVSHVFPSHKSSLDATQVNVDFRTGESLMTIGIDSDELERII